MKLRPKSINLSGSPLRRAASKQEAAAAAAKATDAELVAVAADLDINCWSEFTEETFDDYWLARVIEAEQARRAKRRKRALKSEGPTATSPGPRSPRPAARKPPTQGVREAV